MSYLPGLQFTDKNKVILSILILELRIKQSLLSTCNLCGYNPEIHYMRVKFYDHKHSSVSKEDNSKCSSACYKIEFCNKNNKYNLYYTKGHNITKPRFINIIIKESVLSLLNIPVLFNQQVC